MAKKVIYENVFDYTLDFDNLDFRKHPELYRPGKGEQGVLLVEPYKSELLPYWRFRTVEIAQESAEELYKRFEQYLKDNDFVGADMARKFIQMGYTRARRYANHPSGRKYTDRTKNEIKPQAEDALTSEKAEAARVFYGYWKRASENEEYLKLHDEFMEKYSKPKEKTKK